MLNDSVNRGIGDGINSQVGGEGQEQGAASGRRTLEEQLQDLTTMVANLSMRMDQKW